LGKETLMIDSGGRTLKRDSRRFRCVKQRCIGCGTSFWVSLSELKRGKGKYCRYSCSARAGAKVLNDRNISFEEDPKVKKAAASRLAEALKQGKKVRPKQCSVCRRTARIEGHHEDYSSDDVQWLCRSCHKKRHYGTLLPTG
jgi:hypothetical protein